MLEVGEKACWDKRSELPIRCGASLTTRRSAWPLWTRGEILVASEEAVAIHREFAVRWPDAHLHELCGHRESLPGLRMAKTSMTLSAGAVDLHDPNCLGSTVLVTGIVTTTGRNRPENDEMQQTVRQRHDGGLQGEAPTTAGQGAQ